MLLSTLFITNRLQAYFLNIRQVASVYINALLQACLKLPYTRLRSSSSIAATSSTVACLSSWIVMIRLRYTRSFRNPHRKKSGTVRSGDRAGQAMSPKLRTQVTRCCTFQRSIAIDHMKWRPLLYRSSSRQPRQAIVPAQYSNLKRVSRLRTTLCMIIGVRQEEIHAAESLVSDPGLFEAEPADAFRSREVIRFA